MIKAEQRARFLAELGDKLRDLFPDTRISVREAPHDPTSGPPRTDWLDFLVKLSTDFGGYMFRQAVSDELLADALPGAFADYVVSRIAAGTVVRIIAPGAEEAC